MPDDCPILDCCLPNPFSYSVDPVPEGTVLLQTLSSPTEGGSTTGGDRFELGSNVEVCATPTPPDDDLTWAFVNWTNSTLQIVSTDACFTFTLNADTVLTANFSSSPTPPPAPEPSFWWDYEDKNSMLDLVAGLAMTGGVGATNVAGIIANGINLPPNNGVSTALTTDLVHLTGESFSHSVWIKFLSGPSNGETVQPIFYRDNSAGQVTSLSISRTAGSDFIQISAGSGSVGSGPFFQEIPFAIDNNWHLLTVVCDGVGGTYKGYLDAVEILSVNKVPVSSSSDWFLAAIAVSPDTAEYVMDERGFWKGTALSQSDIDYLFNSGMGRTWPF